MYILGSTAIKVSTPSDGYSTAFTLDDLASADWTASAGSPASQTTAIFLWTSPLTPNVVVRITATVGGNVAVHDVYVTANELTAVPSLSVESTVDDISIFHRFESGARRGRRKVPPKLSYELRFNKRDVTEYQTVVDLFNVVGKLEPFAMDDPVTFQTKAWYFDSAITRRMASSSIDYSFRVLEA